MPESLRINVCLLLPEAIAERAISISTSLEKEGGVFVLGRSMRIPHLTLYMTDIPPEILPAVLSAVTEIGKSTTPLKLEAREYRFKQDGYVDVRYHGSPELHQLQQTLVSIINPLRKGMSAHLNGYAHFSEEQKRNAALYGYPDTDTSFFPHVTFTRMPYAPEKQLVFDTPLEDLSGITTTLVAARTEKNGVNGEILVSCPLAQD